MYVPYDEADHDTISLANNLEEILSGATFGSTTDLNCQSKSTSSRPKQIKLVNKHKKSSSIENLKTKEKMVLIKQKLKQKSDKKADNTNQIEGADSSKKKQRNKKSASVGNKAKEGEENGEIEANEVDDDEISDDDYADEYLEDEDDDDDDDQDYNDEEDDDDEYEDEDNQFYPNLSHSSENNNHLESPDDDEDDDYADDEENELILNKSECLLNEEPQTSDSPSQAGISSSLATTTLPTVNTPPADTDQHLRTPYSGRINKNGLLNSKLEYLKNKRTKTGQNDASFNQDNSKATKNRSEEVDKPRRRKTKRYEIASFSPTTTILVKTVNLDRKKSVQTIASEMDQNQKDRIVSSSNKKVSFNMNEEKSEVKPGLVKKTGNKLESLYPKSNIEETIITLPEKKNNQLNPILKSANRLEMLKTNMASSASILRPYQRLNGIVAPVLDKSSDRIYSATRQKHLSLSANDLVQASKSNIKLPPVLNNSVQSSTDATILMAGSSNNLNTMGLSEVKKKVTDLSRYCYCCKKKTGLASSYMCR